jgi:hypothetical protein
MRKLLTDEVRDLPTAPIPVDAVINDGRRRLWRHRAAGGTATFAAVAALALVAPSIVGGGEDSGGNGAPAASGVVDPKAATYSTGSTIHDGDRRIDVSPHEVASFVQTDDGFVFVGQEDDVYFTDGESVERIGDGNWAGHLEADDIGSYVGWVDYRAIPDPPEYVVYDTSTRSEVMRWVDEDGGPSGQGEHTTEVVDIDGDLAYVRDSQGFVAWNLTEGTSERIAATVDPHWLWGVADGQLAHVERDGRGRYLVVSEDPRADRPRVPIGWEAVGAELSPTGRYVVTGGPGTAELVVTEMPSQRDVTPDGIRYLPGLGPMEWVDDDSFYIGWGPPGIDYYEGPAGAAEPDIARCWISTGECRVVAENVAPSYAVRGPNGEIEPLR